MHWKPLVTTIFYARLEPKLSSLKLSVLNYWRQMYNSKFLNRASSHSCLGVWRWGKTLMIILIIQCLISQSQVCKLLVYDIYNKLTICWNDKYWWLLNSKRRDCNCNWELRVSKVEQNSNRNWNSVSSGFACQQHQSTTLLVDRRLELIFHVQVLHFCSSDNTAAVNYIC